MKTMKTKLCLAIGMMGLSLLSFAEVDRSTPENTVKSLATAIEKGNIDDALACVKGSTKSNTVTTMFESLKTVTMKIEVTVKDVAITGANATAKVEALIKGSDSRGSREMKTSDDAAFEKIGEAWLLVNRSKDNPSNSFINTMTYLFTHDLLVPLDGPRAATSPKLEGPSAPVVAPEAPNTVADKCLMNAKQVGLGVMLFVVDHKGTYKLKPATWTQSVVPYLKNKAFLTCSLDKKGTVSYTINALILGVQEVKIKNPERTVMLYEGSNGKLSFKHNGKGVVVYCDGHAELISPKEAKKLIWKP